MQQDDPNFPYREQIIAAKRSLRARMPDLKERFAALTRDIEAQVVAIENERAQGISPIPDVRFDELESLDAATIARQIKQRGIVVVRGVFDPARIARWNDQLAAYITDNLYLEKQQAKRGLDKYFSTLSSSRPQIYGLYWSKPQMEARQSEELAKARRWLNRLWGHQPRTASRCSTPTRNAPMPTAFASASRVMPRSASRRTSTAASIERWIDPRLRQGLWCRIRRRSRLL